jgi:PAS domain S-box-containing protein
MRALRDGATARATVRSSARGRVYDVEASPHPNGGAVVTFDDVTEIHALAERHRLVVETSGDAIVITDLSRRIAFANPSALTLFARQGALPGTPVDELLAPGQAERVRDHEQMAFAGRPQRYEAVIQRPDGEQRLVSVSTAPLRDVERVTGIVASMRDVTDERRARDAVLLSEARYRNLFETATDLIYTLDPTGGITSANDASCRAVGLDASQVLGHNITQFIVPDDAEQAKVHFAAALKGEARRYDCRLARPSGEQRLLSVTNSPIRQGRDVIGILGIARDVTEERARALALARSEDRYTRLVESASDSIFTLDEEGMFTSVNAALELATGRARAELIGRHFTAILEGSPDRDKLWVVFAETLRGNRSRAEFRFIRPNGEVRTGSINSAPISEGERTTGALAIVRDVSDEKVLLQQVLQQEKLAAIGQLVSGVAHELNNPLAGVMAFSQLLLASGLTADQQQAADTIQNEGRRAAKIVNNLLTFARQHPPERSPVNINQVLRDTIALRRYAMQSGQVQVDTQLDDGLPPTWADPTQLQQVFLNLLTNAEHAVGQNSGTKRVQIRTARAGAMILVSIGDNGPGIPDDQRDRIFNPFFTTKPVGQGTGLGLSLTDGIVREHGGRIRVESAPGAGATFIVELPLTGPHLEVMPTEAESTSLRRAVLVVSADTFVTDRARLLEDDGHDVAVAPSGELGLRRAGERRWDVVLLDMRVPDMSPSRFYARLVAQAPRVAERVIFVADTDGGGEADWVRGTGRTSLPRPLTHDALLAALRSGAGH